MKRNATMKTFDIAKTLKTLTTLKSVDTVRAEQLAAALAKPADQRTWGDRMKIQADEFERFKAERAAAQSAFAAEPTPPSPVQYMPQPSTPTSAAMEAPSPANAPGCARSCPCWRSRTGCIPPWKGSGGSRRGACALGWASTRRNLRTYVSTLAAVLMLFRSFRFHRVQPLFDGAEHGQPQQPLDAPGAGVHSEKDGTVVTLRLGAVERPTGILVKAAQLRRQTLCIHEHLGLPIRAQ